ncbi:hypothetical protein FA09DRAFT_232332 [Tilletiopsis washingtonensis]|uniref:Uncharacterized protein n=1 Tax=Tilletiopsis washingtonensis TaxID=58919 RepID=A0A316ZEL3_9BASI|nr:hypothetical protein FA09DRAFT_232332 [Tilletiopsis washingtonensis]PWN99474.1 hypothetical protein FA09DRAFT_232332 [Tilletiopsis washingtonensis]
MRRRTPLRARMLPSTIAQQPARGTSPRCAAACCTAAAAPSLCVRPHTMCAEAASSVRAPLPLCTVAALCVRSHEPSIREQYLLRSPRPLALRRLVIRS